MNRIVHFEIPVKDIKRAVNFYKNVFGWEISEWKGLDMEYWMVMTAPKDSKEPGINGGMLLRKGDEPQEGAGANAFVCTVQVESIDDVISKIENEGGVCITPKYNLMEMAWQAYYKDTEGNIFGVHEAIKKGE
jgi:uncharacterized protein